MSEKAREKQPARWGGEEGNEEGDMGKRKDGGRPRLLSKYWVE